VMHAVTHAHQAIVGILDPLDREVFLSVECGTIDQAERSLTFLTKALGKRLLKP
jgi:hypothetical protein